MIDPWFCLEMMAVGIGVGLISNIAGLGGGILMVPAFLSFVPGMDPHTAKGTSLFIIIFVAAVNAWRLNRTLHRIPWRTAGWLALGSIAGGYVTAWLTSWLHPCFILIPFLVLVLLLAAQMFLMKPRPIAEELAQRKTSRTVLIGLVSGAVGGATGTGGGAILVPLSLKIGLSSNAHVVGLSNMVMVPTSVAASIAHLMAVPFFEGPGTIGQVNFLLAPLVFIGAQVGSSAGRWVNARLTLRWRRWVLGVLLVMIALRMVWQLMLG